MLITGGAGFIGSHILREYLLRGHEVVVVDDLSTGRKEVLPSGVRFHRLSINDRAFHDLILSEKPDMVNHHAAQVDVYRSVNEPIKDAEINIIGTINLLDACRVSGVKKVVFASSGGAAYGCQRSFPADESHPTLPTNPYGITKLTAERYLQFYQTYFGITFVALRYANVYGPRQGTNGEAGVVSIFTKRLLEGQPPIIYGDGGQTRDFVFIDDVVSCNVAAMQPKVFGVFNVGTGVETNIRELADELIRLIHPGIRPIYAPARLGEAKRSCLNPGILQKEPPISLKVGLQKTVDWFRHDLR